MGTSIETGHPLPRALRAAKLLDSGGAEHELAELCAPDALTLVLFLRHFGCAGCNAQVVSLAERLYELDRLGVRVVLVGQGEPAHLQGFLERTQLLNKPVVAVTDPTRQAFQVAGLRRSVWAIISARSLRDHFRLFGSGFSHARRHGDVLQQGGAVLVDEAGIVLVNHENRSIGDLIDLSDVISIALKRRARRLAGSGKAVV
jgi:peroxiredoxin